MTSRAVKPAMPPATGIATDFHLTAAFVASEDK